MSPIEYLKNIISWMSYFVIGLIFFTTLSCTVNPYEAADFDEFYNQSVSLDGNLIFYHFNEDGYSGDVGDVIDEQGGDDNSNSVGGLTQTQGIFGSGIRCQNGSGVDLQVDDFDLAFTERTISVWVVAFETSGLQYIYEEGGRTREGRPRPRCSYERPRLSQRG